MSTIIALHAFAAVNVTEENVQVLVVAIAVIKGSAKWAVL
jgi:hypothetical protein